jgi:uncharacterized protein (DUF2141 family)
MRVSIGLVAFALLLAAAMPAPALAQDTSKIGGIKVEVTGFRNDKGQLGCSLWPGPQGFPRDDSHILGHLWAPIRGARGECFFKGVPAGDYAVTLFHDENGNGKFDSNFVGYPLEGYGFSNNAKATFKAPSFDECKFHYDGNGTKQIPVQVIYR